MLPIVLDPGKVRVGLAGAGASLERRQAVLRAAGLEPRSVPPGESEALSGLDILYVAGLEREAAAGLAGRAKALGILVNVEDEPQLCDFHVPATVRRGDLLLTVSSAGRSPGLVKLVREWLSDRFGMEWAGRVDELGRRRTVWREGGVPASDIAQRTRDIAIAWLP